MTIQSDWELKVTREKLNRLRQRSEEIRSDSTGTTIDKLTLQSLRRMVNELEEEIAVYQTRVHHPG